MWGERCLLVLVALLRACCPQSVLPPCTFFLQIETLVRGRVLGVKEGGVVVLSLIYAHLLFQRNGSILNLLVSVQENGWIYHLRIVQTLKVSDCVTQVATVETLKLLTVSLCGALAHHTCHHALLLQLPLWIFIAWEHYTAVDRGVVALTVKLLEGRELLLCLRILSRGNAWSRRQMSRRIAVSSVSLIKGHSLRFLKVRLGSVPKFITPSID